MKRLEIFRLLRREPPKWARIYLSLVVILYGVVMMYYAILLFPGDFWHLYSVVLFGAIVVALGLGKIMDEKLRE